MTPRRSSEPAPSWLKRHRTPLVIAVAVLVAAAFVALLWRGAPWLDASRLRALTPVQRETAIDSIRGRLLQLAAGLVIAGGLVYTALTFRLNHEGHVTDRYTKAIDQLGSERLDVRLGAIYALERVMIDSERDHPTIVEVLAAYIRGHAPLEAATGSGDEERSAPPASSARLATDVQAALTVLGRRPPGRAERGPLDLSGTDLTRARLTNPNLADVNLRDANLTNAILISANLAHANLFKANLTHAHLGEADLTRATLTHAHLAHAHLGRANLTGAYLNDADLTDASLLGANLTRAELGYADLTRTELWQADLTNANLAAAILTHAKNLPSGSPGGAEDGGLLGGEPVGR